MKEWTVEWIPMSPNDNPKLLLFAQSCGLRMLFVRSRNRFSCAVQMIIRWISQNGFIVSLHSHWSININWKHLIFIPPAIEDETKKNKRNSLSRFRRNYGNITLNSLTFYDNHQLHLCHSLTMLHIQHKLTNGCFPCRSTPHSF